MGYKKKVIIIDFKAFDYSDLDIMLPGIINALTTGDHTKFNQDVNELIIDNPGEKAAAEVYYSDMLKLIKKYLISTGRIKDIRDLMKDYSISDVEITPNKDLFILLKAKYFE